MDSPFNKGFGPGHQSPALSQAPPAGSAYQVNVNRTKTKKWVEARVQSYDGDDWGADEYHDLDHDEPPPAHQLPTAQRPGHGTGVASLPSSLHAPKPPKAAPSQQPRPPPFVSPAIPDPPTSENLVDHDKAVSSPSTGAGPSTHLSSQPAEPDKPSAGDSAPLVRPSDIYRRVDEENTRHHKLVDTPRLGTPKEALHDVVPPESSKLDSPGDGGNRSNTSDDAGPGGEGDGNRRDSVSPQLPDVARMSAFGVDLFASTRSGCSALEPMIPENNSDGSTSPPPPRVTGVIKEDVSALMTDATLPPPAMRETPPELQQKRPSVPHTLEETKTSAEEAGLPRNTTEEHRESAISDANDNDRDADCEPSSIAAETVLAHPQARQPTLHLGSGWPTIPPLRTPSPRASIGNGAGQPTPAGEYFSLGQNMPTEGSEAHSHRQPGHGSETISMRRQPSSSTRASSPVKDNDILSDEIIRSLSPGASSSADPSSGDGHKSFLAPTPKAVRESSYTLRDYDSYWEDTSDKAQAAPPLAMTLESNRAVGSPLEASALDENARVNESDSRKRFSWEAVETGEKPRSPKLAHQSSAAHEPAARPITRSASGPTPPPVEDDSDARPQADAESPTPAELAFSTSTMLHEGHEPSDVPQPPSPLSVSSEKQASVGRDSARQLRSGEGAPAPDYSSVFSPTPPLELQTSPAGQPSSGLAEPRSPHRSAQAPSMTFREIMALPAPAERITRYNETREYFASVESGLNTWLESLQAQNPEYADGTESLAAATSHPIAQAESHSPSASAQHLAQQPYYQQYLNATAPSASSTGRSRPAGLQMPSQTAGSAFGHPSHQIGFKSKEFMHSAGKMGKGLLSKGKNKLRGSGDKGESANSLVQTNSKQDRRRSSWAFSLGARSRPSEAAPRAASAALSKSGNKPSSPEGTRQEQASPHSNALAQGQPHDPESLGKPQPVRYTNHPGSSERVIAGLTRLEIPPYLGNGVRQPGVAKHASQLPDQSVGVAPDQSLDDWVVVSSQDSDEQQVSSPEHNLPSVASARPTVSSQADDGSVALQSLQARNDVPKRISSFVGLPPIRRSSTFGLATRAKRASRRFSLDDDEVGDNGDDCEVAIPKRDSRRPVGPDEPLSLVPSPVLQSAGSLEPALGDDLTSGSPVTVQEQPRGPETLVPLVQRKLPATQLWALGSFDAVLPVHARLSPMLASPIPGLATGPWKLEESHLCEPLHSVTRHHRPGTGNSQQHMFFGYDKETGTPDQLRQKSFDVPPSSAQRWPDLFYHPAADDTQTSQPQSRVRGESDLRPYRMTPPLRGEAATPGSRNGDLNLKTARASAGDFERDQQGLGIIRDPGNSLTGTSYGKLPAWAHEAHPGASESSIAAETREAQWKPSSFRPKLTGHTSADHGSPKPQSTRAHEHSRPEVWASGMPSQLQPYRKPSLVGVGPDGQSAPNGARRSSTSSFVNESHRGDAGSFEAMKKKNRLSSMVKLPGFKDMLYSSGAHRGENSQAPSAVSVGTDGQPQHRAGQIAPPPAPFLGPARSNTTSPSDPPPPQAVGEGRRDRDARRSSVSSMISDLLGRKPAIKPEGRGAPRHAHSSSDLQSRHRQDSDDTRWHGGVAYPAGHLKGPSRPYSSGKETQTAQGPAASLDALRLPQRLTTNKSPQLAGNQTRPSPLGFEASMTRGAWAAEADCQQPAQGLGVVPKLPSDVQHRRYLSTPLLLSRCSGTTPQRDGGSPLAGIGAQHDAGGEAAFLRSSTVSPDLSVKSDGKAPEQQPAQQASSSREPGRGARSGHHAFDVATDGAKSQALPAEHRHDPSSSTVCHGNSQYSQQSPAGHLRGSGAATPVTAPHVQPGQSTGNYFQGNGSQRQPSLAPVPHDNLHQNSRRDPQSSERGRPPPQHPKQQPGPHTADQTADLGRQVEPQRSGPTVPQRQREHMSAQADSPGSRWKGLKHRVSGHMGHVAPQSQGKTAKGNRAGGSKILGAFKRISRSLEPNRRATRQEGTGTGTGHGTPQPRQSHYPHQPSPGQSERQTAVRPAWNITPAQSQRSSPSGAWAPQSAVSPQPGLDGQPSWPPAEPKRRAQATHGLWEPVYDQVPIPRGYQAVHGEGLVAPTAHSVGCHTASGRYAQPQQQPHGGHVGLLQPRSQQSPPMSQKSPLRHDSVSSLGMGPSPPLESVDDAPASTGLGVAIPHQPSMNSIRTWQESKLDGREAVERQQDMVQPRSEGHGNAGSHGYSNVGNSISADADPLTRFPRSPILHLDPESPAADKNPTVGVAHWVDGREMSQHSPEDASNTRPGANTSPSGICQTGSHSPRDKLGEDFRVDAVKNVAVKVTPAAELDDTAERYERSRRLESQEEKILFRAEDAEDYRPQMSATSWPGQEWNPYGEPGFGDWRED